MSIEQIIAGSAVVLAASSERTVDYFADRGDWGAVVTFLVIAIVVLWKWGGKNKYNTETLVEVIKGNTLANADMAKAVNDFRVEMVQLRQVSELQTAKITDAFLEAIKRKVGT